MAEFAFSDVTLSSGDIACWGGALTNAMAARLASRLNRAGLAAIEVLDPETVAACVARGESPWRRAEDIAAACPATPLRARISPLSAHGAGGCDVLGAEDMAAWARRLAAAGVGEILCDEPLDDAGRMAAMLGAVRDAGARPGAVLWFDDRASDADLSARARALATAGAETVQLRDEAGTLTTDRLSGLLDALLGALGEVPLSLHAGCAAGLGPQVAFAALAAGVARLDVALPALANGPGVPSSVNLVRGAPAVGAGAGAAAGADTPHLPALEQAERWLAEAADREGLAPSAPWNFDLSAWIHHLPGAALRGLAIPERLVFAHEAARVAAEAGGLPPRAPFARAIALQAFWHVTGSERWTRVHPVLARAIRGAYGPLPGTPLAALAERLGALGPDTAAPAPLPDRLEYRIGGRPGGPAPDGYRETTPEQALALGLLAHVRDGGFGHVSVQGPEITMEIGRGGDA